MIISVLQGQVRFLDSGVGGYPLTRGAKRNSGVICVAVIVLHGLFIVVALSAGAKQKEKLSSLSLLQLIQVPHEHIVTSEIEKPAVNLPFNAIYIQLPQIDFVEFPQIHADLSVYQSSTPYELPNPNDDKYRNVFDPKMRQKLIEAQGINRPRAKEKQTAWTEIDGRTFVDMGNGECLVSMRKVDSRERGTNWGMTRCGKTDSQKMMDNVNADLEARKHPLKTQ